MEQNAPESVSLERAALIALIAQAAELISDSDNKNLRGAVAGLQTRLAEYDEMHEKQRLGNKSAEYWLNHGEGKNMVGGFEMVVQSIKLELEH